MKKNIQLKILFIILSILFAFVIFVSATYIIMTSGARLDDKKFKSTERGAVYYDVFGEVVSEEDMGVEIADSKDIPEHVKNAFVAIEDKRFYSHHGVDFKGLLRAMVNNVKSFSFKEGASTITQQLIKNTHLNGEKTIKRKLKEIKLATMLEKKYDKDKILETYLNTIYFGEGCYGIKNASERFFGKSLVDLTINDGALLAAVIKAPSVYSPYRNFEKCKRRKNTVLLEMKKQGYISESEYAENCKEMPEMNNELKASEYDFLYVAKREISEFLDDNAYNGKKLKIYTTMNSSEQNKVEKVLKDDKTTTDKSAVIFNHENEITAYYSTCGEIRRQTGSALKPLLVYAPAFEKGVVQSLTPILDEKTNFDGYSPKNYNDKYYGYVSAKESLAKSLNACAVKILNYTGVKNAEAYLKKTAIPITDQDDSLCVALGCTQNGATLCELSSAYGVFISGGLYKHFTAIKRIETESGAVIYNNRKAKEKIYESGTCDLINDALSECVKSGTAKKLSFLDFPVYSKTGTVGTEKGNTDAYNISYSENKVLGVWFGNSDNSLMNNSVTGGAAPSTVAYTIWKKVYEGKDLPAEIKKSEESCFVKLDKLSYEEEHSLIVADMAAPERFLLSGLFMKKYIPQKHSERFSSPKIENYDLIYNNNEINISLCLTEYCGVLLYKEENGNKTLIKKIPPCKTTVNYTDSEIIKNSAYSYYVVPYFENGMQTYLGNEIFIGKIKTPPEGGESHWWNDELT